MAKKDKAKKAAKKEAKQAKQAVKQTRTAAKAGRALMGDDDLEATLSARMAEAAKRKTMSIEVCGVPAPRANGTLVAHPSKNELLLMGGECFNGRDVETFYDLYTYNVAKREWRQINAVNPPPPRTSHQAVAIPQGSQPGSGTMYVFGGDFTSPAQLFRHYNDLWALDLKSYAWEQIKAANPPAPRSGHRMVHFKRKLYVFGGFFDSVQDIKYYDDLHVFDLDSRTWTKAAPASSVAPWPSARSGFGFTLLAGSDTAYLYGGYCSHMRNKKTMEERHSVLTDLWSLHLPTLTWTKLKSAGAAPAPRSGAALFSVRGGLYSFGGVRDPDSLSGDAAADAAASAAAKESGTELAVITEPLFHNDVTAYSVKRRAWEPVAINAGQDPSHHSASTAAAAVEEAEAGVKALAVSDKGAGKGKGGKKGAADDEDDAEVLAALAMLANSDDDDDDDGDNNGGGDDDSDDYSGDAGARRTGYVWPRRNAMTCVHGNLVFVFGGVFERGLCEVTLNDLHYMDARKGKNGQWWTLSETDLSKQEWFYDDADLGENDDDDGDDDDKDDGRRSAYNRDDDDEDYEDDEEEEEDEDEDDDDDEEEEEEEEEGGAAPAVNIKPAKGENLNIYFGRTKDHWVPAAAAAAAAAGEEAGEKELRKAAFALAAEHFNANK